MMKKNRILKLTVLLLTLLFPVFVNAAQTHLMGCTNCHKAGANFASFDGNACVFCHTSGSESTFNDGLVHPAKGYFEAGDASNAIQTSTVVHGAIPGKEISHMWQRMDGSNVPEVGSQEPTTYARQFNGRYGITRGKLVCFRCHDPHADATVKTSLLKVPVDADQICSDCHLPWYQNNANALLTHPVGSGVIYNSAAADATKFNASITNVNNGDIRKVSGFVSCTSCHGVHSVDSNSATVDGYANYNSLSGDGYLLRSDGPRDLAAVTEADFTQAEAQLKSNLCQACHVYKLHGKVDDGAADRFLGCLDCHSGHAYNDNDPYYFVLRKSSYNPITNSSVSFTGYNFGGFDYIYNNPAIFGLLNRTEVWKDNSNLTALGYCETCHGEAENIPKGALFHSSTDDCATCHLHNSTGWAYSFQNDASAATCGDCHGFPPYKNQPGDRTGSGVDGGYAFISTAWNYANASVTYFKDETMTPHNAHAAGGTAQGATADYIFGNGVYACEPCHENYVPTHQQESTLPYTTGFRDINFYANVDKAGATYNTGTNQCSALYCHSNGAPRTGDGPIRNYATGTVATPAWTNGKGTIIGKTTPTHECAFCHGNTATTMSTKGNSAAHAKHLDRYGNDCSICHNQTAVNSTTLASGANRIDLLSPASGGKHVNTLYDIVYKTSGSVLYNALGSNTVGVNYDATTGTCSVYCHDPADSGTTADWDSGVGGAACGSCHGVTSATLTTNSHAIHIDSVGANISCDACHGAGASTAVHGGHVDGVVTQLTVAASCDVCHGVEVGDTSPIWGNSNSIDCLTCHTGASVTSYTDASAATVTAPDKGLATISGHNRPTASNAYPITGSPAANKTCTTCHLTAINADHVGGAATKLLQVAFSCEDCHSAAGSRSAEATLRVQTHSNTDAAYTGQKRLDFTALCTACHDPHGAGSNIAMIGTVKADFLGSVVLYNVTGADSFDESDAANGDDICATCHTATVHNNQAATGTHHEGENCLTCHGHDGVNGGFMPTGGTACNDCHGNPPVASDDRPAGTAGAHEAHVSVASHEPTEDKFDCEVCHPGAGSFELTHSNGSVSLAPGVTNGTCANACHLSTAGDGAWSDSNGLNCDSCHYYSASPTSAGNIVKPLSSSHNKHFDSGKVCTDCHADNSADIMAPHSHIDDNEAWALNAINDGTVLQDRGAATQDEAAVTVATWNDTTDTCNNAACHNPSGLSYAATWMTPNAAGCDFCHSSTNPDTAKATPGSHGAHMSAVSTFGLTVTCASCHPDNSGDNGHLSGAVELNGFTYSASLSDYTNTTFGSCTTTTCHNSGDGTTAVPTPAWGTDSANCTICHNAPPTMANNRHSEHVANTAIVSGSCGSCHLNATATTITASTHIDGTRNVGSQIVDVDLVTAGNQLVAPGGWNGTCTNNCHLVDTIGTWTDAAANKLTCLECHTSGKAAGGTLPTSGLHSGTLTVSANTHDDNFQITRGEATPSGTCITCHSGIDLAGDLPTTHINGTTVAADAALATAINYANGSPSTCAPNAGLATCHDDGGAWSRKWNVTAKNTDDTQCANCHGDFDRGWVGGVVARHAGDAQVEAGHDGVDKCYMCHTYKKSVTVPYDFAVKHRDGTIQLNNDMIFTDNGAAVNTCNGCHDSGAGPYGTANGEYGFIDTNKDDAADGGVNRWSREMVVGGPAGNCNGCHVSFGRDHTGVNESAAVHTYHTGSPMSPGCGACHPADSGPGGLLHEDGTVDFGGTYLTTALNYTGADFANTNCSTANGCHNSDNNSWVADSLATCADCHAATGKLLDQGAYPPVSNAHTAHLGNAAYVGTVGVDACDACHGVTSSVANHLSTHNDGNVTVLNDITAYTLIADTGNGTCTNNCHAVVSGRDWNDATTLVCADCHAAAKMLPALNAWPVTSAKHTKHIDNNTYVAGDCADCHGASSATGAHASHKDGTINNTLSYVSGTQTCTNSCHVANTTGDWTVGGALVCRDCHAGTYVGGNGNLPASGLHAITPTISAATHDDTLASGNCINCHDAASPSNAHKTGTLNTSGTATFTFHANVSSYVAATGCNASCHADAGAWSRKWSTTAANSNGTECANCHGTFVSGFTAGVVARHQTTTSGDVDGDVAGNHDGTDPCYTCHTYKAGDITYYNFATQHRDNNIQVNNQISFVDNGATVGCSACHNSNDGTADEGHAFADSTSRWTRALQNGPSANCTDCHISNGRTHLGTNESATVHTLHENSSLFVGSCEACHANSRPGNANHNNGTVDFGGTYLTTTLNYSVADMTNTNCSTANGCHDSDINEWAAGNLGGDSCTDCHASGAKLLSQNNMFPPTGNKHTIHVNQNVYVPGDCADCHGAGGDTGAHATHRSGAIDDTVSYNAGTATCTNSCHIADTANDWTSGTLACIDCHGTTASGKSLDAGGEADMSTSIGPNAGEHDIHMANSNFVGGGCADCHGHSGALGAVDGHLDGPNVATITVATSVTSYSTTLATCTNACHNVVDGNDWLSATGLNCADCHNATALAGAARTLDQGGWPVVSAKHTAHINNNTYVPGDCTDCHGASAATGAHSGHKNGSVENSVTYVALTQTCTITCHVANTTGDWTGGGTLSCRDCHASGTYVASSYLPGTGLHAITPTVSATTHDDTLSSGNCVNCHDAASPSNLHKDGTLQSSSVATFTFHSNVTAYSAASCNATCHSDAGDWARQWSTTAANSDGAECSNCHGGIGVGYNSVAWVSGTIPDHTANWDGDGNGPEVMTSHSVCKSCHGFNGAADKDDNYLLTMHRNNQITMNGGTNYNATNWGCDSAGCHGDASAAHAMADSGWTVELGAFAAGADCWGCHGDGVSQTWPDGTVYPDRAGVHVEHIAAIAVHMAGGDTLANRNATCIYCHPGGVHSGDQAVAPADVSNTDTNNDGVADLNDAARMKKVVGGADDNDGFYRSTPQTCSTVACHAGAPFTPHWYTDTVAPGDVTLTAVAGPVPRSIRLTWTAVGDDGILDGTAYKYDIRMGTTTVIATDFGSTTNHVQGVPTVKRNGSAQEAIVHGVDPNTTYYFALRTYDVTGNFGGTANSGGYVSYAVPASPDTTPPVLTGSPTWYGLDSAKALDTSGTVALSWTRAEDHSMPITYDIWWSTGTITYGAPQASTSDTHFRATGLTDGMTYNFAVRARDAYGNTDTNTVVLQAIPQGLSTVPKTEVSYYADGTATSNIPMLATVHTTDGTAALPAIFIGPTTFTATTDIIANGFSLNIINGGNAPATLRAELGYITGASTFNSFPTALWATDQTVAKRTTRLVTFKLNGAERQMTAAMNAKLGVRVSISAGAATVGWGPTSKGGILSFAARPVNVSPTAPTVSSTITGANASIWWAASTDTADGVADTVHYDVYGSANGGADNFPYIIATGLTTNATVGAPLVWDTQAAGIALAGVASNVQVRVEAGDVINGKVLSHTAATSSNIAVDNSADNVAPGAIAHFEAETRPKQGSVYLHWTAPGDDGPNNGRAATYDIRLAGTIIDTDIKYDAATQLDSEPYPDFGGNGQGYEVLDLADGTYFFAIKALDEGGNASPLAYTSATVAAGPKCGICHSTPPDETASIGNHAKHGFTMAECANCHGTEAATFTTAHQDGVIKLGWKTATPVVGTKVGYQVTYTQGGQTIYQDASPGGFNVDNLDTGDKTDSGSCFSWSTLGVSGCHGPAASASWTPAATLSCSACHGDGSRVVDQYSHSFDDPSDDVKAAPPVDNHGYVGLITDPEAERKYVGAHVAHLNSSFRMSKGDSCRLCHGASRPGNSIHADGIIDVELDLAAAGATATWTPGTTITAGTCGSMDPGACHPSAATPAWDSAAVFDCNNCHGMSGVTPSHVTDPNKLINLPDNDPDVTSDPTASVMPGNCTWCHVGGHPKDKKVIAITNASPAVVTTEHAHNLAGGEKVSIHTTTGMTEINNHTYAATVINATQFSLVGSDSTGYGTFDEGAWIEGNGTGIILIPNDSRVGINYKSGGIHLKANIGARGEVSSEAELCWSCHTPNNISEWGADSGSTNTATDPGNGNVYNFGTLNQPNWIGATWTSGTTGTPGFSYKTGVIRSTHSTDTTGTSALTGTAYAYTNGGVDAVGKIHCSNCHDVHNSNTSPLAGDNLDPTGPPYLRGTWKSNPYKEDGAPQSGQTYTAQATAGSPGYGYGAVPRANPSTTQQMGGFWIDQNSGNPTAGWSYESSAALCQLCHSTTVDNLDQTTGENLWITATNGHANSVLGGSGTGAANIFLQGVAGGRNGTIGAMGGSGTNPNVGGWMGFQNTNHSGTVDYGYGPRSAAAGYLLPLQISKVKISVLAFAWGNSVDATTVESGYHQFSCSKCHNPHASRLPKLMITNCLDVTHNTWDDDYSVQADWGSFNSVTSSWGQNKISHLSTAQNCHRMVDINGDNTPDEKGWNKVTPW